MSATLGAMLKELDPTLAITIFERLPALSQESSDAWNNAGTGHAALCELNYTPQNKDGSVDIGKALKIDEQFEHSKQFWATLVAAGRLPDARAFIHSVPHMSFVIGDADVAFLHERYSELTKHHLFDGMELTDDPARIAEWAPLLMDGRRVDAAMAATRSHLGTDVNFGALTRGLFWWLTAQPGVSVCLEHEVRDLERLPDGEWSVQVKDLANDEAREVRSPFVFIGAGGAALPLLGKSDVEEAKGYGGFPVGGQWLRCTNARVIARHHAKVYGKAPVGSPPMSVPHLDARMIDGEPALLFGPFACVTTKFLKHGSWLDLAASLEFDNVMPMLQVGWDNMDLTKYLLEQASLTPEERIQALRVFMPTAKLDDWELVWAGQRVQVIKRVGERGVLEFGTEVVSARDGSLAAVLGASPGASTAVSIMLELAPRYLNARIGPESVRSRLRQLVPTIGRSMAKDAALTQEMRAWTDKMLRLS
ncbi:MAG: malate dehydrogenase (quinone) [Deltaproteobacteria bacterium]|nr:malate dehydrogenase (quinone) [Deltaproteobacteria bacterium]